MQEQKDCAVREQLNISYVAELRILTVTTDCFDHFITFSIMHAQGPKHHKRLYGLLFLDCWPPCEGVGGGGRRVPRCPEPPSGDGAAGICAPAVARAPRHHLGTAAWRRDVSAGRARRCCAPQPQVRSALCRILSILQEAPEGITVLLQCYWSPTLLRCFCTVSGRTGPGPIHSSSVMTGCPDLIVMSEELKCA
jgi:hypothetical protein